MSPSRRVVRRSRRRALTLIDLVVTILIIGIIAAVAAPAYTDVANEMRVEAAAKRIVADLKYARRQAMTRSTQQAVDFNVATNSYELIGLGRLNAPSQAYVVDLTDDSVTLTLVNFNGSNRVTYDHHGEPWKGDMQSPLNSGLLRVQSGPATRTIDVDGTTGRASVQ